MPCFSIETACSSRRYIIERPANGRLLRVGEIRLIPGTAAAARSLAQAGFALVLVSNQAGYAKGKTSLHALWLAHERVVALTAGGGFSKPNPLAGESPR
jgi:histidinol phosphatase-like enzyme